MKPAPYVPVDKECPECGAVDWGLVVHGGPMLGTVATYTAACYKCHAERPVRKIEQQQGRTVYTPFDLVEDEEAAVEAATDQLLQALIEALYDRCTNGDFAQVFTLLDAKEVRRMEGDGGWEVVLFQLQLSTQVAIVQIPVDEP
jgi:hypothetical protein